MARPSSTPASVGLRRDQAQRPAVARATPSRSAEMNAVSATTGDSATCAAEMGGCALDATSHTMTSSSSVNSTDHSAKNHAARELSEPSGTRLATAVSASPVSGGWPVTGASAPPCRYAARPALTLASR